jgi:hypothetical protein
MMKFMTMILIIGFLIGCATIPDVTLNYHPAMWNSVVTVTQTVGCTTDKKRLVVLNTPSVTTTYFSNVNKIFEIKMKKLEGGFNDSDFNIVFTDDGRLKSINQSTTGQGETIVKSAVAVAVAIPMLSLGPEAPKVSKRLLEACHIIDSWGNSKPITLNYRVTINSENLGQTLNFEPTPDSYELYERLKDQLPDLTVKCDIISKSDSRGSYAQSTTASNDEVLLELQKISSATISIGDRNGLIGYARIVIPEDDTYTLPIPKAALFGKQIFSVSLSEAGAIMSIGYGKNAGTAGALNALGSIVSTQTAETKAAELKAQADLIAQQQRLVGVQSKSV